MPNIPMSIAKVAIFRRSDPCALLIEGCLSSGSSRIELPA